MRLLSRFGTKSAINLGKAIPLVGGLIGGGFDAYSTQIIGDKAKEMFILEAGIWKMGKWLSKSSMYHMMMRIKEVRYDGTHEFESSRFT